MSVIVVARRWDRLGARLGAIVNAATAARLLGCPFRFVWPRGRFKELDDPAEIFAADFLRDHEIDERTLRKAKRITGVERLSLAALRVAVDQAGGAAVVIVEECMQPLRFAGQSAEQAAALFRSSFQSLRWSRAIDAVRSKMAALAPDVRVTMHVRAGDIVDGTSFGHRAGENWSDFLPAGKYIATAILERFAQASAAAGDRVLVFSDSDAAVARLRQTCPDLLTPGQVIDGLDQLTESQRAVADILLMARMTRLLAPAISAFSRMAANVSGTTRLVLQDVIEGAAARAVLDDTLRADTPAAPDAMRARDVCWLLDLYADQVDCKARGRLAAQAAGADPGFCRGQNWLAATRALAGDREGFAQASAKALPRAQAARGVQDDPLVETLAVAASARLLFALLDGTGEGGWGARAVTAIARLAGRPDAADAAIRTLRRLRPHQTHLADVLQNLCYQRAVVRHAQRHGLPLAPMLKDMLGSSEPDLAAWRWSGPRAMAQIDAYPAVSRLIERFTILLSVALGRALGRAGCTPLRRGYVDHVIRAPSGLHWVIGWAHGDRGNGLVGLETEDGTTFWGVTHLRRLRVALYLRRPWAQRAGFAMPVILPDGTPPGALRLIEGP